VKVFDAVKRFIASRSPQPEPKEWGVLQACYEKHRALASIVFQAGGRLRVPPSTVARMREEDEFRIVLDDDEDGGYTVRLAGFKGASFRAPSEADLIPLRERIDLIDTKIVRNLEDRTALARAVLSMKRTLGLPDLNPQRERLIVDRYVCGVRNHPDPAGIARAVILGGKS